MPMFRIKAKAEFEVVIEAENKKEANEWGDQVLADLIIFEDEYSDRLILAKKEIKVGKAKLEVVEDGRQD